MQLFYLLTKCYLVKEPKLKQLCAIRPDHRISLAFIDAFRTRTGKQGGMKSELCEYLIPIIPMANNRAIANSRNDGWRRPI